MKIFVNIVLILILVQYNIQNLLAQSELPELIPYCMNSYQSKWGYYNTKTKKFSLPTYTYEINEAFKEKYLKKIQKEEEFSVEKGLYGKYYIVDKEGKKKEIAGLENKRLIFEGLNEGLALFSTFDDFVYRYIDKNGNVVLEVKTRRGDEVKPFYEGRAIFEKKDKVGFIDKTGKIIIPAKFESARPFSNGRAAVKLNNQWGFIDLNGNLIVPFIYREVDTFVNGLAWVNYQANAYGYIDIHGNEFFPRELIPFQDKKSKLWGVYIYKDYEREKQEIVIEPKYDFINHRDGYYVVSLNKKKGVLNFRGEELIPFKYDDIHFQGKFFMVLNKDENSKIKYGVIDQNGRTILEPKYDAIRFDCNWDNKVDENDKGFIVSLNGKLAFFNFEGKEIVSFICDSSLGLRVEGNYLYIRVNGKKGLVDLSGKVLIPPKYEDFAFFEEGYASYYRDGKWGHLDINGNEIIPPTYDDRYYFYGGSARVKKDNKYGLISYKGELITPLIYDEFQTFYQGIAIIGKDGKYGYINTKGQLITPLIYDNAHQFYNGLAAVKRNSLWGFIDQTGKEVITVVFNKVEPFRNPNATVVVYNGKYGLLGRHGKFLIEADYDKIYMYEKSSNVTIISFTKDGRSIQYRIEGSYYCECDLDGNCKSKPIHVE